ncbi:RadC family protein [Fusobacterium sp.]|uniref:JAB domain-containing protein n=1 Tax=Fusobacterium sp. TaxID=68766 RepID=UPI00396C4A08
MTDQDSRMGHRKRIRKNYLLGGIKGWQEYQIVELLLTYSIPRKDVKELAKNLIRIYGNLFNILNADTESLLEIKDLGPETATFFKLIGDIVEKTANHTLENYDIRNELPVIKSKNVLINFLKRKIAYKDEENFIVLFLNNANKLVGTEELFCGTIDKSAVYPREVVASVIKSKAKGVIFAHNHPSGNINPSRADIDLTEHMIETLKMIDVFVLDHVIVSRENYYSFLEEGLIT